MCIFLVQFSEYMQMGFGSAIIMHKALHPVVVSGELGTIFCTHRVVEGAVVTVVVFM